jgi:hypothetical protein
VPFHAFPAKFHFWIIWVEGLGHLVYGPMPFIFWP